MTSKRLIELIRKGGYEPESHPTHDGPDLVGVNLNPKDQMAFVAACFKGMHLDDLNKVLQGHRAMRP